MTTALPTEISSAAALLGRRGGSARTPAKVGASRANGAKGGRIPTTVHVTRLDPDGGVYGHSTAYCDESGCSGTERYLGTIEGAERDHVYELAGRRIVAEIVD